jgi:TonB family protein
MTPVRAAVVGLIVLVATPASAQRHARPHPSATVSVESFTGALTATDIADLPTRASEGVNHCAAQRTATIVTDESTFELTVDERGHVTTATVMSSGDIIVDEARTRWLSCATQALRRVRLARHDAGSTVSVRVTWSSGDGARGGELGSHGGRLSGRRSSTFDHAIETRHTTPTEAPPEYSRDVVRQVVSTHAAEVRHCYDTQLVDHPGMEGTLTLAFTIAPDGTVTNAAAQEDGPNVAALTACVITAVRRWTFPAPDDGVAAAVSYPFVFRQAERSR